MTIPKIQWCSKCVYPSSSAVSLEFDEDGVADAGYMNRKKILIGKKG